ncbi:universal stress protein [Marivibrio halodurans]|uniref:Universal stress protein n=1 Tax=Marivibrio halodurans TaxID=2039722 RepID=A0A8J7S6C7_9PROT|nr:universal stress protein [Marivibrio halodurans]MBP5857574.1 universal stress protein [Marivibrio halodurans]
MYSNILLAIDLGHEDSWAKSLPTAVEYAQKFGSSLHLISVVPDFGMSIVGGYFPEGYEKRALEAAGGKLASFVSDHVPEGVDVHPHIAHGRSYDEILSAAKKLAADLIVIGSHQPGTETYFLGSTASRVVRFATCSVLVVRD